MPGDSPFPQSPQAAEGAARPGAADGQPPADLSGVELLRLLQQDRLWLLQQIDSGRWPEWRLDLAALERELGQLLAQAEERQGEVGETR